MIGVSSKKYDEQEAKDIKDKYSQGELDYLKFLLFPDKAPPAK